MIQCDADGQHHIEDICKCADLLARYPDEFIIGERNFDEKGIPFRSRFGNKCTGAVFRYLCGIRLKDTQTGLKGIPGALIGYLIETPGERYEYDTGVLLEVKRRKVPVRSFDIRTIYINENESSHFNPLIDSARIYSVILKYLAASLITVGIDLFIFSITAAALKEVYPGGFYIVLSMLVARISSGFFNFFVNKKVVFHSESSSWFEYIKYIFLCVAHIGTSSVLVGCLVFMLNMPEVAAKIFVDTVLFFLIYYLQSNWVFQERGQKR